MFPFTLRGVKPKNLYCLFLTEAEINVTVNKTRGKKKQQNKPKQKNSQTNKELPHTHRKKPPKISTLKSEYLSCVILMPKGLIFPSELVRNYILLVLNYKMHNFYLEFPSQEPACHSEYFWCRVFKKTSSFLVHRRPNYFSLAMYL